MKILFINSEHPPIGGGAGNASANIARLLARMGNDGLLLTSRFEKLPQVETCDNLKILRIPALRRYVDRSTASEQFSFMVSASYQALKLTNRSKPDVTLAFFGLPSGAAALLLKLVKGIPYVVSLRGGDVPGFRPYDFRRLHKIAAPLLHIIWDNASAVVTNSKGLYQLAAAFDPTIDITIIPNGVDLERFSAPERSWTPANILSVGRVVYQKGLDIALQALAGLKDLEWEWRIAGDGPQLPRLQAMIEENGLKDRVHFLGWLKTDELKKQYREATLFLFPSRHEGMPNAVLEAMACGLPVAATRVAGNEELVIDGETGVLVPGEDVEGLREALRPLLTQASMRKKMGGAGRQRVEASFSWTRIAEEYRSILEKAIK
jgi:glycosyltransferase involved in cell wall biosynthesis